jgi:hypothetical protein
MAQPGLKVKLDGVFRDLGLGHDVSSALLKVPMGEIEEKVTKRGMEEVSDDEVASSSKKPNVKQALGATIDHTSENKSQKRKRQREQHTQTCISCREIRNVNQFPKLLPSSSCTHGREMCRMCVIAWIRTQVHEGKMPRCALCDGTISYAYVEGITKKKHDNDILSRQELSNSEVVHCLGMLTHEIVDSRSYSSGLEQVKSQDSPGVFRPAVISAKSMTAKGKERMIWYSPAKDAISARAFPVIRAGMKVKPAMSTSETAARTTGPQCVMSNLHGRRSRRKCSLRN